MKWIIDTDYSSNSQKALEILISQKLDIIAITCVHGIEKQHPYDIQQRIQNDLKNIYKIDIPVYKGTSEPYIDYVKELKDDDIINPYHLSNKVNNITNSKNKDEKEKVDLENVASLKIIDLIKKYGKSLRILCLSALTNLSLSVLLDNTIGEKDAFDRLIVVGGSYEGNGNSGVISETNFRMDPVAAKNVVMYYNNVMLFPLENEITFMENLNKDFSISDFGVLEKFAGDNIKNKKSLLHTLAILYILNNDIAKEIGTHPADVDIEGKFTRGALSMEKYPWIESKTFNHIEYVKELDYEKLKKTISTIN